MPEIVRSVTSWRTSPSSSRGSDMECWRGLTKLTSVRSFDDVERVSLREAGIPAPEFRSSTASIIVLAGPPSP